MNRRPPIVDIDPAARQRYEALVAWEVDNHLMQCSTRELSAIADRATGEMKQGIGRSGYGEKELRKAIVTDVRRQLKIPTLHKWLRGKRVDRGRVHAPLEDDPLVDLAGREAEGTQLAGYAALASGSLLTVISDELIAHVARAPELLHRVSARRFEELVAEVLASHGFAVELTPLSHDGGRDILARTSGLLGDALVLVECKKYSPERPVGVAPVRALYGTVMRERANAGVLVTTSTFTRGARAFQLGVPYQLSLKDFAALSTWVASAARNRGILNRPGIPGGSIP